MSTHNECFCGEMTKTCIQDSHFSGLVLISAYIYSIMSFALFNVIHVKSQFQALKLEISGLKKFVQTETWNIYLGPIVQSIVNDKLVNCCS